MINVQIYMCGEGEDVLLLWRQYGLLLRQEGRVSNNCSDLSKNTTDPLPIFLRLFLVSRVSLTKYFTNDQCVIGQSLWIAEYYNYGEYLGATQWVQCTTSSEINEENAER